MKSQEADQMIVEPSKAKPNSNATLPLNVAALLALALPVILGMVNVTSSRRESQAQNSASPVFEYEVVSIKPNKSADNRMSFASPPDGFSATNVTVMSLFRIAYAGNNGRSPFRPDQILGAPDWFSSEKFDIQAKMDTFVADALGKLSADQKARTRQEMLQGLLVDRLRLTVHRETRELPLYELVVVKSGSKLKEAIPGDNYANGLKFPGGRGGAGSIATMRTNRGGQEIIGQGVFIGTLISALSPQLDRAIVDKTGLTGKYDFTLEFAPGESSMAAPSVGAVEGQTEPVPSDSNDPLLFDAIQEQLGLKLVTGKGPIEAIVIDHVQRPAVE
jgi:uncharacterized protein (TIGR03435 family)